MMSTSTINEIKALIAANRKRRQRIQKITDIYDGLPPFTAAEIRKNNAGDMVNVNFRGLENAIDIETAAVVKRHTLSERPWRFTHPTHPAALMRLLETGAAKILKATDGGLWWPSFLWKAMHPTILTGAAVVFWAFPDDVLPTAIGNEDLLLPPETTHSPTRLAIRVRHDMTRVFAGFAAEGEQLGRWNEKTIRSIMREVAIRKDSFSTLGSIAGQTDTRAAFRAYLAGGPPPMEMAAIHYFKWDPAKKILRHDIALDLERMDWRNPTNQNTDEVFVTYERQLDDREDFFILLTYAPPSKELLGVKGLGHRVASIFDAENIFLCRFFTAINMKMGLTYEIGSDASASKIAVQQRGMATLIQGVPVNQKPSQQQPLLAPAQDTVTAFQLLRGLRANARFLTGAGEDATDPREVKSLKLQGLREESVDSENVFEWWWRLQLEKVCAKIWKKVLTLKSDQAEQFRNILSEAILPYQLDLKVDLKDVCIHLATAIGNKDRTKINAATNILREVAPELPEEARQNLLRLRIEAATDADLAREILPMNPIPPSQYELLASMAVEMIVAGAILPEIDAGNPIIFARTAVSRAVRILQQDIEEQRMDIMRAAQILPVLIEYAARHLAVAEQIDSMRPEVQRLNEALQQIKTATEDIIAKTEEMMKQQQEQAQAEQEQAIQAALAERDKEHELKLAKIQAEFDLKLKQLEGELEIERSRQASMAAERERKTLHTLRLRDEMHAQRMAHLNEEAGRQFSQPTAPAPPENPEMQVADIGLETLDMLR